MKVNLKAPGVKKRPFDIQHAINLLGMSNNGGWIVATKADQKKIDNYLQSSNSEEE